MKDAPLSGVKASGDRSVAADQITAPVATGDGARIVTGDVFEVQAATVNVNLHAGPVARSAYLEQVRRIVPLRLRDRGDELDELAAFSMESGESPYMWWQAPAWTGKSALMSWFVLHPPSGVQVVSFFVTARYKGQDDRAAFTDVVLEQLAEILGQPLPAYLPEATREAHLLRMFALAAGFCRRQDQQLVLVVDGLDEDRGVTIGPGAYSIAALLPPQPPAGLRIIVTGRPDPPIPDDVPTVHPLRDHGIVRVLGKSPWAEVVREDMQRELKRLLYGTSVEQDLLGLVTAAGGGLSGPDLAELTGVPVFEIEENLHAVAGRTFTSRSSRWQPGAAPPVYVLGHEELQTAATRFLGSTRLADYRQRLHSWAESYRQRGWPAESPEYLLLGYYRMLLATKDVPRIVACATDQARHDRMLDIIGGDTAALAEITDAQDAVLSLSEPDLFDMARLAIRRTSIAERNANIPTGLPAVWAAVGNPPRAEALARAISDPDRQAEALTTLVAAATAGGDFEQAQAIARQAEAAARAITDPNRRAEALTTLVAAAAAAGDLEQAQAIARAITDPARQAEALITLVAAATAGGDLEQALAIAHTIPGSYRQAEALITLVAAAAAGGDLEQALAIAHTIPGSYRQAEALITLVAAATAAGDLEQAQAIAHTIPSPARQAEALTTLVAAATAGGDFEQAQAIARQAEAAARAITDPNRRAEALTTLVAAAAAAGDLEQAQAIARAITDPARQAEALITLVAAATAGGDLEQALAIAHTIPGSYRQAEALTTLVAAAARRRGSRAGPGDSPAGGDGGPRHPQPGPAGRGTDHPGGSGSRCRGSRAGPGDSPAGGDGGPRHPQPGPAGRGTDHPGGSGSRCRGSRAGPGDSPAGRGGGPRDH